MYNCKILKDSISPGGVRITTLELTFPRIILAEFNTHRILSKNSASSRAIPTEKISAMVQDDPFVPDFNHRVTGMGVGEPLNPEAQRLAKERWLEARDAAVTLVDELVALNVDKSRANRLLEPFMWHTVICTGTEWENFLALRTHTDAQPEFQVIASLAQAYLENFEPEEMWQNEWHLPLVDHDEIDHDKLGYWLGVSAGRCARVSYNRQAEGEDPQKSYERAEKLLAAGHMSPFEHQATPMTYDRKKLYRQDRMAWSGNFFGWTQYRKCIANEDNFARRLAAT